MKNFLKFLFCFLFAGSVFGQTGLSESEFQALKKDYGEMIKSDSYKALKANRQEFMELLKGASKPQLAPDEAWDKWIAENIGSTGFGTVENANEMRAKGIKLTDENLKEFSDMYDQFKKTSREQKMEIIKMERTNSF